MTGPGHHATGFISGFWAAWAAIHISGVPFLIAFAAIPFSWWGGVFPDSSEHFLGIRWIKHRTLTHWVPLWLGLLLWALYWDAPDLLSQTLQTVTIGFAAGGLTHLLFDWPNPRGIPFLTPRKLHSLKLWKSGKRELLIVLFWSLFIGAFWMPQIISIVNLAR